MIRDIFGKNIDSKYFIMFFKLILIFLKIFNYLFILFILVIFLTMHIFNIIMHTMESNI